MVAAEHQFRMSKAGTDGVPAADKLRYLGKLEAGPEAPPQAAHLLGWFNEISAGRTSSGFGWNPLTWADLAAWSRLTGTALRPWEVRMLKRLDHLFLKIQAEGA